ncbi:hypothetical protein A9Q84_13915 [Halobacteriovorax marinus]|uniref:Radical SAM core domain-containing protein n=1 Tax=Halobacteriovorax marinus TaxID=97084 RepID=A0A1Y5F8Y8_9BACT|nr:hypothetical protein A9Q84_13915 [Halobacteriovorax marinus]
MTGNRALCCQSKVSDRHKDLSLDEFWNSDHLKNARKLMMEGTAPVEFCDICVNSNLGSAKPLELFKEFSHLEEELISQTDSDGTFSQKPFYYDYRIDNACNLSCRMCCAEASSKIEKGVMTISSTSEEEKEKLIAKKNKNIISIIPEIIRAIESGEVSKLYFASGEGVLQKEFWQIIDCCIESDMAKNMTMAYHTNLSLPLDLMKKYFLKFSQFKKVELIVSIDAEGKSVEFIRDGLKWNKFIQNLEYSMNKSMQEFAITLTTPTLLNITEFLKFLYHYKLKYNVNICHDTGLSGLMSPLTLDRISLIKLVDEALEVISSYADPVYFEQFTKVLINLKKAPLLEDSVRIWQRDLCHRIEKSEELDNFFKRKSLIEYYKEFDLTREWIFNVLSFKSKESLPLFEQIHLNQIHSKYLPLENSINISHNYGFGFSLEDILDLACEDFEKRKSISLIGSAPTVLNKFISGNISENKYKLYEDFVINESLTLSNNPAIKLLKSEYIGVFSFLLRNKSSLTKIAKLLDFMTYPFKRFISFHYYILFEIRNK